MTAYISFLSTCSFFLFIPNHACTACSLFYWQQAVVHQCKLVQTVLLSFLPLDRGESAHRDLFLATEFGGRYKSGDNNLHKKTQVPDKVKQTLQWFVCEGNVNWYCLSWILVLISAIQSLGMCLISELQFTQMHNRGIFSPLLQSLFKIYRLSTIYKQNIVIPRIICGGRSVNCLWIYPAS